MQTNRPPQPIRVSVALLSQMSLYLASLQVDVDYFLRTLGVDPRLIKSPDGRIPIETYLMIQDGAAGYTQDPCFGLHMGEYAEAGSWSILGYLMMNCATLAEALEKSERYSRVVGNLIETRVEEDPHRLRLVFASAHYAPRMSRHCFDAALSSSARMLRALTGTSLRLLEVGFADARPAAVEEYERIFGCPVLFGQKENYLAGDPAILNTRIPLANPALLEYFEKYARGLLAEIDRPDEYTREVTKIILANLDDETLSIEKVAGRMSISVRTLQNRLAGEDVLFSALLKDIRHRLARKYLHENYSVDEITYLLGFSEPSVFRRAFKKWSGVTPKEYRQRLQPSS